MTQLVAELDQTHIRSASKTSAAPISRLRRARLGLGETILNHGWLGQVPGFGRPPGSAGTDQTPVDGDLRCARYQAVAPSMTTPAVAYFQNATRSFRAKAVIIVLRMRPFMPTRWWNQRLSAESG
jgi:hypothetical protein